MVSVTSARPLVSPRVARLMQWIVVLGLVNAAVLFTIQRMVMSLGFDFLTYFGSAIAVRDGLNFYSVPVIQHAALAHHQPIASAPYLYPPLLPITLLPVTFAPPPLLLLL